MASFIFDACVVWGAHKAGILDDILNYLEQSSHKFYMTTDNILECPQEVQKHIHQRRKLLVEFYPPEKDVEALEKELKSLGFQEFKTQNKNDYRFLAGGMQKKIDFLVTNDYPIIEVFKQYKQKKGIPENELYIMGPATLFYKMSVDRKDLFDWKRHIKINLNFFHYSEMENISKGIKEKGWSISRAQLRFSPYKSNIEKSINIPV